MFNKVTIKHLRYEKLIAYKHTVAHKLAIGYKNYALRLLCPALGLLGTTLAGWLLAPRIEPVPRIQIQPTTCP